MKILIDMQGAQSESRFRGIGSYTLSFVEALIRNKGAHEVILMLNELLPDSILAIRAAFGSSIPQDQILSWGAPGPVFEADTKNENRRLSAEVLRQVFIENVDPDVVLVTSLFEGLGDDAVTTVPSSGRIPTAVILYDLIPLISPDQHFTHSKLHQEFYSRKLSSLKNADVLLAISESSKQEGVEHLEIESSRVMSISSAAHGCFRPIYLNNADIDLLEQQHGIDRPFVMYTGGADERKNLPRLIEAFSRLPSQIRDDHQLCIVGRMPQSITASLQSIAEKLDISDNLVFVGYVDREDLVALYNLCKLFVFPSLHEGFGLPPLEAMSCGTAVISSNATSLPEVIGNTAALFDPTSVDSMEAKLKQALTDEFFRKELVEHGLKQAKQFNWEKTAISALLKLESISRARAVSDVTNSGLPGVSDIELKKIIGAYKNKPSSDELAECARSLSRNLQNVSPSKRLLLDVSVIVHSDAKSGIQRVVRSIASSILQSPPRNLTVLPIYLDTGLYRIATSFLSKHASSIDEVIYPSSGDIYLALDLNMHLTSELGSVYSEMKQRGVALHVIVYDLLLARHPEWWLPPNPEMFRGWLDLVTELADSLICISADVAKDTEHWLEENQPTRFFPGPKVSQFHLGADFENSVPSTGLGTDYDAVTKAISLRKTFLMVGTLEPRKGHKQVLEAFEILWSTNSDVNLVIVGKEGWLVQDTVEKIRSHHELDQRLFLLDGVSDEYLQNIYTESDCLIAASLAEGFGLPLIEAAKHNIPIIARDLPVFREVASSYAYYFTGMTAVDLAEAVDEWIALYSKNKHPSNNSMPYITWHQSANQLLASIGIDRN